MVGHFTSFSFKNSCWKSRKVRKLKETLPNLVERISKKEVWESKSSNHLSYTSLQPFAKTKSVSLRDSCIFTHEESQIFQILKPFAKSLTIAKISINNLSKSGFHHQLSIEVSVHDPEIPLSQIHFAEYNLPVLLVKVYYRC